MSLPSSLDRLLLMRHASFDPKGKWELNEFGRAEIEAVSQKLRDSHFIDQNNLKQVVVLTSPIRRAVQTAELVSKNLGLDVPQKREWLYLENCRDSNLMSFEFGIGKEAKITGAKTVLCISHHPVIESFIDYICRKSGHHFAPVDDLKNSEILVLNLKNFGVTLLSPIVHSHHF
ncbi:MAG TPA: phosphoglycerate mutase family protein [Candidatus Paceibacterota bacterium]|nr:phosphoglycerate mutase family protein [Candidatus Paceibacterota bacterium]